MNILKLYAELQVNPQNKSVIRQISDFYEKKGMMNESMAFKELLEKKTHDKCTNSNIQ